MAHYITKECVACNACLPQCPSESIVLDDGRYLIDADTCTDCRVCASVCPTDAIRRVAPAS